MAGAVVGNLWAVFLLGAAWLSSAMANVTYNYMGQPLVFLKVNGSTPPGSADPVQMSFTFSDDGTRLLDWNATQANIGTITKSAAVGSAYVGLTPIINIRTDSTGQVSSWYVSVYTASDKSSLSGLYKQSVLSLSGMDYAGTVI